MNLIPSLDERLNTVFDLFPVCEHGADIGADHGRLSCKLLSSGKVQHMQITDLSESSLEKSRRLITMHELQEKAQFLQGDGLFALSRPADAIAICGMGGEVIADILLNGRQKLNGAALILCPQTDIYLLRRTIVAIGYYIDEERIASAAGRLYCVIRASTGESHLTEKELFLGPCLMKKRDQKTKDYYQWRYDVESCIRNEDTSDHLKWLSEVK